MDKINIAELLKYCPKNMELDCLTFDNVFFQELDCSTVFPIICYRINNGIKECMHLTEFGSHFSDDDAKCIIFPKGKTTWEGFVPPCKFKDGDILSYTTTNTTVFIYRNKYNEPKHTTSFYVGYTIGKENHNFHVYNKSLLIALNEDCEVRFATEEEKQKLFQAINDNGYKWNEKTNTLEKLPKFKVGDRITNGKTSITIGYIDNEYYYEIGRNIANRLFIKNQDEWNLVSNKFDINTLKPFESRVLVRDSNRKWRPAVYGFCDKFEKRCAFYTVGGGVFEQCIPYEGNEDLLGTNNDCNEYFKTWER